MASFNDLQQRAERVVEQGHGFTSLIEEVSNSEMGEAMRGNPKFQEAAMRRLLTKRGSGPEGQPLENTFCSNWSSSAPHLACLRIASIACPQCNLVRYCSRVCLQEHQEHHRELCCSPLLSKASTSHSKDNNLVSDMPESQHNLPTLSNPPFPVYSLLRDLELVELCSPSTTLTPSSSTTCPSSTPSSLKTSPSLMTSSSLASPSSTPPSLMIPLSCRPSSSTTSPSVTASPSSPCPPVPSSPLFPLPYHLRFFFPSAYDLRNVLQTACQIPEDYKGHVTFFINSAKSILAVRDLLILELLRRYESEGIDAAVALWYSSALTNTQTNMFYLATHRILHSKNHVDNGRDITSYEASFLSSSMVSSLRADFGTDATRILLSVSNDKDCKFEPKEQYWRCEEESHDWKEKCAMPAHFASRSKYQDRGLALPFGACDASFQKPNLLRYSSSLKFIARYSEDALCGWDMPQLIRSGEKHAASNMDLYGCLFFHVRDMMQTFLRRTKSCCIELRLTQLRPRTLAEVLYDAGIKFHRIDGCALAHDKASRGFSLKLPETVDLLGKLLEKDESSAWPSLLLTSTSDWGEEISTIEGADTELSTLLETMVHDEYYDATTKMLQMNIPAPVLNRYLNDFSTEYFLPYLVSLKVDEEAEKMGLQRNHMHRIVSPCYCLPLSGVSDKLNRNLTSKRFYFHMLFSGFTFLERFLEWGWACLQSPKCELKPVENEAATITSDAHSKTIFDGETNALVEQSRFSDAIDDAIKIWGSFGAADYQMDLEKAMTDLQASDTHLQMNYNVNRWGSLDDADYQWDLSDLQASDTHLQTNYKINGWDSLDDADYQWDLSDEATNRLDVVDEASNQWGVLDHVSNQWGTLDEAFRESMTSEENDTLAEQASATLESLRLDVSVSGLNTIAAAKEDQLSTNFTCDFDTEQTAADTLEGLMSCFESQAHTTADENVASARSSEALVLSNFESGLEIADLIKALIASLPLAEILGAAHQEDQPADRKEETTKPQDPQQ